MSSWLAQLDPATADALVVISVGAAVNAACAAVGCYLVLRRMSLLGDALAHAVLPGLVAAFIFARSFNIGWMLVGACVVGLLTTLLTQTLERYAGVAADSAMGVVFTSLFALGVLLIQDFPGVDLDADCVLFGQIEYTPFRLVELGSWSIPRAWLTIGPVLVVNVVFVALFWKELLIGSFDAPLAKSLGLRPTLIHYLLMALVAVTAVASFEAVGSILVVAMLIVPGATAHLLTDRLSRMLPLSAAIGVLAAVVGYPLATHFDANTSGMMAVVVGACYGGALLAAPRYGLLARLMTRTRTGVRIVGEDILALLYRLEEYGGPQRVGALEAARAVGGGAAAYLALVVLWRRRQIERADGALRLTDAGRRRATQLVRSHRLWEAYLVEKLGLKPDHVHEPAERIEHFIDAELQQRIEQSLPEATQDPHGRAIPSGGGE